MTRAEAREMRTEMRQAGIRFRKACEKATESIEAFVAAWNDGANYVSLDDIRSGRVRP